MNQSPDSRLRGLTCPTRNVRARGGTFVVRGTSAWLGRAAGNGACAGQAASRLETVGEACRPVRRPEDVLPKLVSPVYEFASRIAFATAEYFRGTIAILCRLV